MAMRLASFNLESLFDRAKALNQKTWAEGRPILEAVARLNELFAKPVYTPADKTKIVEALTKLGLAKKTTAASLPSCVRTTASCCSERRTVKSRSWPTVEGTGSGGSG